MLGRLLRPRLRSKSARASLRHRRRAAFQLSHRWTDALEIGSKQRFPAEHGHLMPFVGHTGVFLCVSSLFYGSQVLSAGMRARLDTW